MGLVTKVFKAVTKGVTTAVKGKIKPQVLVDGSLVPFKAGKNLAKAAKKVEYQVKYDITMPIAPATLNRTHPMVRIQKNALTGEIDEIADSEMGNIAIRLAKTYENAKPAAKKEIETLFDGFDVSVRSKGANSVYSKLKKKVLKGKVIRSDAQAYKIIQDAIGGRITMRDLTPKDITETLKTLKIGERNLTAKEQSIIQRFFRNEKLTDEELKIAQKYSRTVKLALAEKQSAPVFNRVMLSSLKEALESGATTIEKLEKSGISKDIINELKRNPDIVPLKITELNNYTGHNGIPYFTDKQIAQIREMQVATGNHFDIITCPEAKRFSSSLTKMEADALKESGYTTAQFNAVLKDGSLAEIQVRGKGPFGEVEHIAYDSRQEKNTLGHIYDEYVEASKALKPEEIKEYNKYLSAIYDYYRDLELGIVSPKPVLPAKFNQILSESNMIRLHTLADKEKAILEKDFVPHIKLVA